MSRWLPKRCTKNKYATRYQRRFQNIYIVLLAVFVLHLFDDSVGLPPASLDSAVHRREVSRVRRLPREEESAAHGGLAHLLHGVESHGLDRLVGVRPPRERIRVPAGDLNP